MTIKTQHYLYCDGKDCPLDGEQAYPGLGDASKTEIWKQAEHDGWVRQGRKHFCPQCTPKSHLLERGS